MTLSSGVIELELKEGEKTLNVVKYPRMKPTRIEIPTAQVSPIFDVKAWDQDVMTRFLEAMQQGDLSKEFGEFEVNGFWPNLGKWSSILWDPKRIPEMTYKLFIEMSSFWREMIPLWPWHWRLFFKLRMPKSFSKVNDMKKLVNFFGQEIGRARRFCIMEYVDDLSKTDEHYIRLYENAECWGFENVGAATASMMPTMIAGMCRGLEREEREWNAIETKCIGLGDPYCEIKVVRGEIDELQASFEAIDSTVLDRMHDRLMDRLMGFMLQGKLLWTRPRLGSTLPLAENEMNLLPLASERYCMALRMGGVKVGREVSEHLNDAGIEGDDAVKHVLNLLEHCKVGEVTVGETIRIRDSFESLFVKFMKTKREEPSCYFTTGFLNGFFSAVKNRHVKETKCMSLGDSYCEWEFR